MARVPTRVEKPSHVGMQLLDGQQRVIEFVPGGGHIQTCLLQQVHPEAVDGGDGNAIVFQCLESIHAAVDPQLVGLADTVLGVYQGEVVGGIVLVLVNVQQHAGSGILAEPSGLAARMMSGMLLEARAVATRVL